MYYSSFGLLALVIHIIINIEALRGALKKDLYASERSYCRFLFVVILYYIADILWGSLYELKILSLVYADTVLYFVSMSLTLLLWMNFIESFLIKKDNFGKFLVVTGWCIFAFQIVTLIINNFRPIVFGFDENTVYQPGSARYIVLGVQALLFALAAAHALVCSLGAQGKEHRHYKTIGFSGVVMTIFVVLQTLDPFLPFYAIGCLLATCLIHTFVRVDEREEYARELGTVRVQLYNDALSGVKNKKAYIEIRSVKAREIRDGEILDFGLIVFDVNDLKKVNDNQGHEAGDRLIQAAAELICTVFKRSPVYRIGGDEFATLLEGDDYSDRKELLASFNDQVEANLKKGEVVVAAGMDILTPNRDTTFDDIFERADRRMYERKSELKMMAEFLKQQKNRRNKKENGAGITAEK